MANLRKRRYFIEKQLQTKYIVVTIVLLLIYTFIFLLILLLPYVVKLTFDYPLEEQTEAARMLLVLHGSIWPAIGSVILIMSLLSIFITHKFAGPIYRLKRVLADVANGNLDHNIKLRRGDDLKDLADGLNLVIGEMQTVVNSLQQGHETLANCVDELEEQASGNRVDSQTARTLLEKMKVSRDSLAQTLGKYSK